uniref:HMG box domain-containing protein n=1 Tax=Globodera pallida TaxID=36090 RepID=A0A183C6A2_GLOPA
MFHSDFRPTNSSVPSLTFPRMSSAFDGPSNGEDEDVLRFVEDVMSIEPTLKPNWMEMPTIIQQNSAYDGFSAEAFAQNQRKMHAEAQNNSILPIVPPNQCSSASTVITAQRFSFATPSPTVSHRNSAAATVIPSAYALFFRDVQREVREELGTEKGSANFGEVSRAVAKRWKKMGRAEKAVYRLHVQRLKRAQIRESALCRTKELLAQQWTQK